MDRAEQLRRRGLTALNSRRFDVARRLLVRARAQAVDPAVVARVDTSRAFLAYETGSPDDAFALCDGASRTPGLDENTRGVIEAQRAMLLLRAGRTADALAAFANALSVQLEPLERGRALINRGGVYLNQGQPALARADFAEATDLLSRFDDPDVAAMAEHNLGYAYLLEGDLAQALAHMDAAGPRLIELSKVGEALFRQDRAEVLIAAGLVARGREDLTSAARVYGLHRMHQRRGEAELALARTLAYSDPGAALKAARNARRRFIRTGADAWRVRADGVVLGAEVDLGRTGTSLVERGDALIDELSAQGLDWGAASVRLHTARVLVRRGEMEAARKRLGQLRIDPAAPLSLRLLARDVRSEQARAQGRRAAALMHIRSGLEELHAWQSSFGSLDLQTMVVGHGTRLARRGLELAVESGKAPVLYEWSERARMLASRVQPVRVPLDDQMIADLAELRRLAAPVDGARVPHPRQALSAEIRTRVRERAWKLRGSGEVTEPASLDEVRAALGIDTALVAWVATADSVTALVVTNDGASVHDLGSRAELDELLDGLLPDLDVAASELPDVLARTVRAQLAARLDAIGALLVTPLLDRIGERRVVLTPSGMLAGTPWTLLPGFVGRPVTVAQSATSWAADRSPLTLDSAGFVAGPRVERAEAEVLRAGLLWPGSEVLAADAATAEAVAGLAARVDVLHLAAHGRHSGDNPLFSGVELVGGPWFGYDIDQLPKVPQVVLLSACEVGRSSVRYGEELIGMTAAWLHAGVRCVIASPAAVSDAAAHDVLTAMHAGLASGLDPAAALAAAVPAADADRPPAPFVCFG